MSTRITNLIDLLQAKRREDPEGFREYLPNVTELLPDITSEWRAPISPFGLTERERTYHLDSLSKALSKLQDDAISVVDAISGLEHCANLILDENLPEDVGYQTLKRFVTRAIGKSPNSYKAKTTVQIDKGGGTVRQRLSVIRGVYLELDENARLMSVAIDPAKVRERRKLMRIVGIAKDGLGDVSIRHDDYLTMQEPHGSV